MANKKATTSKPEAITLAAQQHVAVREFLDQEPTRTNLLAGLIKERGEGNELTLLTELLERKGPISGQHMQIDRRMSKATVSVAAKEVSDYLERQFSNTIELLKAKRVRICVWRKEGKGGLSVGYHFACFNTKTKEYLDGSATRNLFESFWHNLIRDRLCEKLRQEAADELLKKLAGRNDYQSLGMEVGIIKKQLQKHETDGLVKFEKTHANDHSRAWTSFHKDSLLKSRGAYIVSVNAGGGKTTFLRNLQAECLRETDIIPIFLDASQIEKWELEDDRQFVENLVRMLDLKVCEDKVAEFLRKAFKKDIVLLVDGLDQIRAGASEYECLANKILELMQNNVIIASRPSAVMNLEDEERFAFLRLKPFDMKAQRNYFGENYERAKQLSVNAPDLIAIPMLAHMVRMLIEEKQDKHINNRTGLYEKFIGHILTKYKHGKAKLSPDLRTQIRKSLGKIAYDALAEKEPYIQTIPLHFCYDDNRLPLGGYKGDILAKSGLVNLMVEQSKAGDEDCLYFTHQSFQEYLAAEYAVNNENLIQQVITEKWHPKWKEILKFLVGMEGGHRLAEQILNEKDNVIHSKLFLAADLVREATDGSGLKDKISEELAKLTNDSLFSEDAARHLGHFVKGQKIDQLHIKLENPDANVRKLALYTLGELHDMVDSDIIRKIVDRLTDPDSEVRQSALEAFEKLRDKVDADTMRIIAARLDDPYPEVRQSALEAFAQLHDKVHSDTVKEIVDKLENEHPEIREWALVKLGELGDQLNSETIDKIVSMLGDEDPRVHFAAVEALGKLRDKIDDDLLKTMVNRLEDPDPDVRSDGIETLSVLHYKLDDDIVERIANKLEDQSPKVRRSALFTLGELKDKVDGGKVKRIVDKLEDPEPSVRDFAVEALRRLGDMVDIAIVERIADRLEDSSRGVCTTAIYTLGLMGDKVGRNIVKKIVDKLDDQDPYIRSCASAALTGLKDKIDKDVVIRILERLEDEDPEVRSSTLGILPRLRDKIDNDVINRIADMLIDPEPRIRTWASFSIRELRDKLDGSIVKRIMDKFVQVKNRDVRDVLEILYEDGKLEFLEND